METGNESNRMTCNPCNSYLFVADFQDFFQNFSCYCHYCYMWCRYYRLPVRQSIPEFCTCSCNLTRFYLTWSSLKSSKETFMKSQKISNKWIRWIATLQWYKKKLNYILLNRYFAHEQIYFADQIDFQFPILTILMQI